MVNESFAEMTQDEKNDAFDIPSSRGILRSPLPDGDLNVRNGT